MAKAAYSSGRGFRNLSPETTKELTSALRSGGRGSGWWEGKEEWQGIDASYDWRNMRSLVQPRGSGQWDLPGGGIGRAARKKGQQAWGTTKSLANQRWGASGGFTRADVILSGMQRRMASNGRQSGAAEHHEETPPPRPLALMPGAKPNRAIGPSTVKAVGPGGTVNFMGERAPREWAAGTGTGNIVGGRYQGSYIDAPSYSYGTQPAGTAQAGQGFFDFGPEQGGAPNPKRRRGG
jgi:hypothetical protein